MAIEKMLINILNGNVNIGRVWSKRDIPVILQPESCKKDMIEKSIKWLRNAPNWRLGIQIHKYLGVK